MPYDIHLRLLRKRNKEMKTFFSPSVVELFSITSKTSTLTNFCSTIPCFGQRIKSQKGCIVIKRHRSDI